MTTPYKTLAGDGDDSRPEDKLLTLTGAEVGDTLVAVFGIPMRPVGSTFGGPTQPVGTPVTIQEAGRFVTPVIGTHFESTISVDGQVKQLQAAGNLRGINFVFLLVPASE